MRRSCRQVGGLIVPDSGNDGGKKAGYSLALGLNISPDSSPHEAAMSLQTLSHATWPQLKVYLERL